MDIKFSIGEVSDIYDVSIDTLRYYDKIGLLHPTINKDNGYRVYLVEDLRILEFILSARKLEFSIKKIKELIKFEDLNMYENIFIEQENILTEKIKKLEGLRDYISSNKNNFNEMINFENNYDLSSITIETKSFEVFKLDLASNNQKLYNKNLIKAFKHKSINKSYYNDYILKDNIICKNHNIYIFKNDVNDDLIEYAKHNEILNFKKIDLPNKHISFKFIGTLNEAYSYTFKALKYFKVQDPLILLKRISFVLKNNEIIFFTDIKIVFD